MLTNYDEPCKIAFVNIWCVEIELTVAISSIYNSLSMHEECVEKDPAFFNWFWGWIVRISMKFHYEVSVHPIP